MSHRVTPQGWRPGCDKVALNRLLRADAGFGLAAAKDAVDQLLAGRVVTFDVVDVEAARTFRERARELGVDRVIVEEAVAGTAR